MREEDCRQGLFTVMGIPLKRFYLLFVTLQVDLYCTVGATFPKSNISIQNTVLSYKHKLQTKKKKVFGLATVCYFDILQCPE